MSRSTLGATGTLCACGVPDYVAALLKGMCLAMLLRAAWAVGEGCRAAERRAQPPAKARFLRRDYRKGMPMLQNNVVPGIICAVSAQ